MNTPKIKLQKISSGEKSTVFSKTQKKYLPDNYYTYDINMYIIFLCIYSILKLDQYYVPYFHKTLL